MTLRTTPGSVVWVVRVVGSYSLPLFLVLLVVAPVWVLAIVAVQVAVAVAAVVRLGVTLDAEGIVVRNLVGRHRYRWADVELVEWRGPVLFGRAHRWIGLRTRDGRDPDVQGTHTFWSRSQDRIEEAFRRTAGAAGVPVESLDPHTRARRPHA